MWLYHIVFFAPFSFFFFAPFSFAVGSRFGFIICFYWTFSDCFLTLFLFVAVRFAFCFFGSLLGFVFVLLWGLF